jgi:hypothetical protein
MCLAASTVRQLFLLPHQLLLLQEGLEFLFFPELLIRCKDAVPNSILLPEAHGYIPWFRRPIPRSRHG